MKIPIEFITADEESAYRSNTLYAFSSELASVANTIENVQIQTSYAVNQAAFSNTSILEIMQRSSSAVSLLKELEGMLKIKTYEVDQELQINDYTQLDTTDVTTLRATLGQIELLRDVLGAKLNSLMVSVRSYLRQIAQMEHLSAVYSAELSKEISLLEHLEAKLRAVDASKYESKILVLEDVVENLTNLLNSLLQPDYFEIGAGHQKYWEFIEKLIYDLHVYLTSLESRYKILKEVYEFLYKDLTDLQAKAKRLYENIIDGEYIRGGENVNVEPSKTPGFYIVSASKPDITPCKPFAPWYTAPDIKVLKEEVNCPPQAVGSPLHPDFKADPSSSLGSATLPPSSSGSGSGNPPTSNVAVTLSTLKDCNPDLNYWSAENSVSHYVARLKSDGAALNPKNPDHVNAAKGYWLGEKPKFDIEGTSSFYYGISTAMAMNDYPNLVVGSASALVKGLSAFNATVNDFYKCLYQLFKTSLGANNLASSFSSWATFKSEAAAAGISGRYSKEQLVSFYLTYHWQAVCDVQNGFGTLVNDDARIETVAATLSGTKHACQRISFCEAQSNANLLGYAIQTNGANLRVVNVEPDCQSFDAQAQAPVMFGKGQFRCAAFQSSSTGQQQASSGAYFAVERVGATDPTIADALAYTPAMQLMYTVIHESAHSIDYVKGIGTNSMGFSEQPSWTSISGWKKSGSNWIFTAPFKYPSEVGGGDLEPPCTVYGHAFPWEDFAESWTYFVMNPASFKKWYPKRHAFMTNNVVPFLNTVRR